MMERTDHTRTRAQSKFKNSNMHACARARPLALLCLSNHSTHCCNEKHSKPPTPNNHHDAIASLPRTPGLRRRLAAVPPTPPPSGPETRHEIRHESLPRRRATRPPDGTSLGVLRRDGCACGGSAGCGWRERGAERVRGAADAMRRAPLKSFWCLGFAAAARPAWRALRVSDAVSVPVVKLPPRVERYGASRGRAGRRACVWHACAKHPSLLCRTCLGAVPLGWRCPTSHLRGVKLKVLQSERRRMSVCEGKAGGGSLSLSLSRSHTHTRM